jgi:hypothetical protein
MAMSLKNYVSKKCKDILKYLKNNLGLRIVGGVFSVRYFDLTFDPG